MTFYDFKDLSQILQNPKTMLPWNDLFTNEDIYNWIEDNIFQYEKYNTGYLAVIRKSDLKFIGIIGVVKLNIKSTKFYELGYILKEEYRGNGYAFEGANVCVNYIFDKLNVKKIFITLNSKNYCSEKIAKKLISYFSQNNLVKIRIF